jgi:hypothetical protein
MVLSSSFKSRYPAINRRPIQQNRQSRHGVKTMTDVQKLLQESRAEYRQLGKSGLRVSMPILGAMSIGSKEWMPWVLEEDEALPLLKEAYDRGITTWDTGQ